MKYLTVLTAILSLAGCNKYTWFDGPDSYADGFEAYTRMEDLLTEDDAHWTYTQLTLEGNTITLDSGFAHSGSRSLRFDGQGTSDVLSKTSISKSNLAFWEGETVRAEAWYYLEDTLALDWLFLMDLEERTAIGAGPGMRIALVGNQLLIEHKYLEDNILQPEATAVDFPRNQWVQLTWEVTLSQRHKGAVKLWQDGRLIIEATDRRTLPSDALYFQQGTKGMYNSLEIGLTANPSRQPARLWVDDVLVEVVM